MELSKVWVIVPAVLAAIVVGLVGLTVLQPPGSLISDAGFSHNTITPNADQVDDVAEFSYSLSRSAYVTLKFESEAGREFVFRDNKRRVAGDYRVLFSGVVDGYRLEDETLFRVAADEPDDTLPLLETRLLADGSYTWSLTAVDDHGETETAAGTLEIASADSDLPLIQEFEIAPTAFTPNQDGIRDRVSINVYLAKAVQLQVYLEDGQGTRIYLSERTGGRDEGEAGNHEFDFDGGVDQGYRPPPDGDYSVFAVAQDDEGQRMVQAGTLTIQDSGLPQMEIVPQPTGGTVCFETAAYDEAYFTDREKQGESIALPATVCSELTTMTLPVGDLLVFHLTVTNYGETPIRTTGPFPGTVYQFDQRASTLASYEEPGAWRVGVDCDTAESDYPWRWAVAPLEELTEVYNQELDATLYYLDPGKSAEVWGAVRLTEIINARNPQPCWAGLIHEDVGIPPLQNRVGAREVELVPR